MPWDDKEKLEEEKVDGMKIEFINPEQNCCSLFEQCCSSFKLEEKVKSDSRINERRVAMRFDFQLTLCGSAMKLSEAMNLPR